MPQATQILGSFHVVAALHKGDRPCEVRGEVRVGEEAQGCLPRRTYAWLKRWESLTECQLAKREARSCEDTSQGGARLPDGRGDAGHLWLSRQRIYSQGPRPALFVDDALCCG